MSYLAGHWSGPAVTSRRPVVARYGGLLRLAFFTCFVLFLLSVPASSFREAPAESVAPATAAILLGMACCQHWVSRKEGENPWIAAIPLAVSYYLFRYGWGAVVILLWDQLPWEAVPGLVNRFHVRGVRENLNQACQLILLGGAGLMLAASLPVDGIVRRLPRLRWRADESRFRRNLVLFSPVALIVLLFLEPRLPLSIRFAVVTLGKALYAFLVIASYWFFNARTASERARWCSFLCVVCGLGLCLGLITGLIGQVLLPLTMVALGYVLAKGRPPWRFLLVAGPLAFFLVFPFLTLFKAQAKMSEDASVRERIRLASQSMQFTGYREGIELTVNRFFARLASAEFPAIFSQFYPAVFPFEEGRSLALEFSSFVPRFLWRAKPQLSDELNNYSRQVGLVRRGDKSSAVFDAVSEYYVNFGRAGVVVLFIVHGVYIKVLFAWLANQFGKVLGASLYLGLFVMNLDFFGVGQIIASQAKVLPVWIVLVYLLSRSPARGVGRKT